MKRDFKLLAAAVVLLLMTGCALFDAGQPIPAAVPVAADTSTAAPQMTATAAPAPSETAVPEPTSPVETQGPVPALPEARPPLSDRLTADGPWLLLSGVDQLWGVNKDGSALTLLLDEPVIWMAAQPGGSLVAYITGDTATMQNLALKILSLPDGAVQTVTWLTNAETQPDPTSGILDNKIEAVRAILDLNPLAWSPDGSMLAFIGVQDGPSADLYTYAPSNGKVTRLTDGPSQGYGPVWSPDGRYIVHFGVATFGTGAGYSMSGGWAARADGSGIVTLFSGGGAGQQFAGWLNNNQFLIHSWTPVCGPQDLRVQNVGDGRQVTLYSGCFNAAAAAPFSGLALVATSADGLISIDPKDGARQTLDPVSPAVLDAQRIAPDVLAVNESGMQVYGNNGDLISSAPAVQCDNPLSVAGYGLLYAWTCSAGEPGVWISGPGLETWQVFDGPAAFPAWSPDNTLLFLSENRLYNAFFMEYRPAPAAEVPGQVNSTAWVGW